MVDNVQKTYADAYANKVLKKEPKPEFENKNVKNFRRSSERSDNRQKPIDRHGNYDGTDVGFTSTSIQNSNSKKKKAKKQKKPIERHGNYEGTDVGFTAKLED